MIRLNGLVLAALLLLTVACSSGKSGTESGADGRGAIDIAAQLGQLERMPVPAGVEAELWQQLKASLAASLKQRLESGKVAAEAPLANASQSNLSMNAATLTLEWLYYSQGDYDQNGEVNIADLTPIAQHFGEAQGGGFAADSVQSVVDGDGNGEINIADISPIGVNFGRSVASYNIYKSLDPLDRPDGNGDPNGPGAELVASLPFSEATGNAAQNRLALSYAVDNLVADTFFWVRPNDGADGSGQDGTASTVLNSSTVNQPPVAVLGASTDEVLTAPDTVLFYVNSSSDPDGSIVLFELDAEGDGSYEQSAAIAPSNFEHLFVTPGIYNSALRVTDNEGASSTSILTVSVHVPGNESPVAELSADQTGGEVPLTVNFDASASSDPDGSIVKYEWKFAYNETYTEGDSSGKISRVYENAGSFDARVRVTDNQGSRTVKSISITPTDAANLAPIASMQADVLSGPAPLVVNFDASASIDTDGTIVLYNWFLDEDSSPDYSTTGPLFSFEFAEKGQQTIRLEVVDNDNSTSGSDSVQIDLTTGWERTDVDSSNGSIYANARIDSFPGIDLIPRPLVVYKMAGETVLRSRAGTTSIGPFADPVEVVNDSYYGAFDLLWVNGLPGVAYCREGVPGVGGLCFIKASNADGSSWGTVRELDLSGNDVCSHNIEAATIGGMPVVGYIKQLVSPPQIRYVRCSDITGVNWGSPALAFDFIQNANIQALSILDSDGNPATVCNNVNGSGILWQRATAADGSLWGPQENATELGSIRPAIGATINGVPQIFFAGEGSIMQLRASTPDASGWEAPTPLFTPESGKYWEELSFHQINGMPALAYREGNLLRYITAQDADATAWNAAETVELSYGISNVSLTEFNNKPLVLFSMPDPLGPDDLLCVSYRGD